MRYILRSIAVVLVLVLALEVWLHWVHPLTWEHRARKESVKILSSQNSPDAFFPDAFRGRLLVLSFPDQSWLAMTYADNHAGGLRSLTLVRDSGGHWYECHRHYCGAFTALINWAKTRQMIRDCNDTLAPDEREPEPTAPAGAPGFDKLASSSTLEDARKQLLAMGYTRCEP